MQTQLYVVRDKVAELTIGNIIRVKNNEVARRSFDDLLKDDKGPIHSHAQDYDLLNIGSMDEATGIITAYDIPTIIAQGSDWVDANKER